MRTYHSEKSSDHNSAPVEAELGSGYAVLGCLVAGCVGILKAFGMQTGGDVLVCLVASVLAFGAAFYLYTRTD